MGAHRPAVGEVVTWFDGRDRPRLATIIRVYFWDFVDLRVKDGRIVCHVWRVIAMPEADGIVPRAGRWQRRT